MAILNFPDNPSSGDTYNQNGVIYTFTDGKWTSASQLTPGNYVYKFGDTMTGNLGLNDKITLDATDGSAEFAGGIASINQFGYPNFNNQYYADNNKFAITPDFSNANAIALYTSGTASSTVGGVTQWTLNNDGSATFTGGLDVGGSQTSNIVAMAALDVNCGQGNYFTKTISGNSTFTFSNVPSGKSFAFTLEVTHTGGTITWPAAVKWPAETAPTLTTGNTHLFVFVTDDSGSRWRGAAIVDYAN